MSSPSNDSALDRPSRPVLVPRLPPRRWLALALLVLGATILELTLPAQTLNLAGPWNVRLDPADRGLDAGWGAVTNDADANLGAPCQLPGVLAEFGLGNVPGPETEWWTGWSGRLERLRPEFDFLRRYFTPTRFLVTDFLVPRHHYLGAAWFTRTVDVPGWWQGQRILLHLERCHWESRLWVDGQPVGRRDGLSVAHEYDLTDLLSPGAHRLTLRVDNRPIVDIGGLCHGASDQTQGTWNGLVGRLELRSTPKVWIEDVQVYPDVARARARVVVSVGNRLAGRGDGGLTLRAAATNTAKPHRVPPQRFDIPIGFGQSRHEVDFHLGPDMRTWDEFHPALYHLTVTLNGAILDRGVDHEVTVTFGMRDFRATGTTFEVNGRPVFLRGNVDCAVFPKTGYAPMDLEAWRRLWRTYRYFGLNHVRFHSWCPPEAAFAAADETGLYLAPEVGEWTDVRTPAQEDFFRRESAALLRQFGNHPSFAFLALGNERGGDPALLGRLLADWQNDPRRLYGIKANSDANPPAADYRVLVQLDGQRFRYQADWPPTPARTLLQSRPPQTTIDWRAAVAQSARPVIAHETGQFCAYPDVLNEPARFTGYLRPTYLEIARDQLQERGLLPQVPDFVRASGRWQLALYREEIEAHLRTPGLAGFQMLALADFTGQNSAPVGLCDAFHAPKPYLTPAEFRRSCAPTVALARLPRRVWTTADTFHADLEITHFGRGPLEAGHLTARLRLAGGRTLVQRRFPPRTLPLGATQSVGTIDFPLAEIRSPVHGQLEFGDDRAGFANAWDFWVYPAELPDPPRRRVRIAHEWTPQLARDLEAGARVLLLPPTDTIRGQLPMAFTTFYWTSFGLDGGQSSACGLLCDPRHPVFAGFPTDFHANWQWWDILTRTRPLVLDGPDESNPFPREHRPVVQLIDSWKINRKLALLVEGRVGAGRLALCTADLESDLDRRPAARQFRHGLLRYLDSDAFNPSTRLTPEMIAARLTPSPSSAGPPSATPTSLAP